MERKVVNFWCDVCRQDWKLVGIRHWLSSLFPDIWDTKCPDCGRRMVRLVNDASNDTYFRVSRQVKLERRMFADDLVQMGDPRFDFLYPQHKKEREEKALLAERNK